MVFYKVKEFVAKYNNCDKPNIIMKKMRACLNKENCGREVREYRARLSLYLVSEDVDRIASAMDSTYENMILLRWINSGLDSDVDEKINFWLNTKFKQYHSYDTIDTLDWEKYHNDSKLVLVDHELFTSTVKDLLEKSGHTPLSQYLDELDKNEVPTNTYMYWFCKYVEEDLESEYSTKELIAKAQDKHYYDHYRITIIGNHNITIELSPVQRKELENAVNNAPKVDDIINMISKAVTLKKEIPELCQKFKNTFELDKLKVNQLKAVTKLDNANCGIVLYPHPETL